MEQRLQHIRYGDIVTWPTGSGTVEGWRDVYTHDTWHRLVLVTPPHELIGRPREVPLAWVLCRYRPGAAIVNFE